MMTCQTTVPLPDDERRKAADFRSHAHWRRVSIITHPILWSGLSAPGGSVVPCVVRGGGGGGSARWFVGGSTKYQYYRQNCDKYDKNNFSRIYAR